MLTKIDKIFLILQGFIWFIIFPGRYLLLTNIDPSIISLITKAQFSYLALKEALYWGILGEFFLLLNYFFISLFIKIKLVNIYTMKNKNFLFQKLFLLVILILYIYLYFKSNVNQSTLEQQGRLLKDLIIFHIPVYLSIVFYSKTGKKYILLFALILSFLASLITGSKGYFIYTIIAIFLINILIFNKKLKIKKLIFYSLIILSFIIFANNYRGSSAHNNNNNINIVHLYIAIFNRFNGLDYLSTVPENFQYDYNRWLYWPLSYLPRGIYKSKPIFSSSLLLNKKYNLQVGKMLVSYTYIVGIRNILLLYFNMLFLAIIFKFLLNNKFTRIAVFYNFVNLASFWEQDIFSFYTYSLMKIFIFSYISLIFFKIKIEKED